MSEREFRRVDAVTQVMNDPTRRSTLFPGLVRSNKRALEQGMVPTGEEEEPWELRNIR